MTADRLEMLRWQRDKEVFLLLEVPGMDAAADFLLCQTALTDEDTLNTEREVGK